VSFVFFVSFVVVVIRVYLHKLLGKLGRTQRTVYPFR
jgi:hypothetical protein